MPRVGEYRIHAASVSQSAADESQVKTPPRHTFAGHFLVQRFQLEKVQLTLDFPRGVYFRGEKIDSTFIASYYYGQPVKGARIRYTLPNGQSYTESADDQGKLPITFDTALVKPGEWLHFKGVVEGENVGVEATVFLAHLGFSIAVKPSAEVILSGEPFDVSIKTSGADGKPVGRSLKLSVFRTGRRPAHPILSQVPWLDMDNSADAEVLVEEHQVETDESSGEGKILLTLTKGGQYTLRATGTDRFGQPVLGAGKATISDDNDAIRLRIFADGTTTQVGASETVRIHSRLEDTASGPLTLALVTYEGEGIIDYKVLSLKSEMNAVQFRVGHKHFPNFYFAVAAIDGGKLRTAGKHFTVERQLNLAVSWQHKTPLPDSGGQPNYNFHPFPIYSPGKEAEVQVRATDQLGQPVKAEFSLALVDEALFAQYPETLTPINDFFQEGIRREAAMRTASSCTFRYAPATRRIVKEVLAEEQRLRDIGLVGVRTTQSFEALKRRTLGELVENITLGVPEATSTAESETRKRKESIDAGYWIGAVVTDNAGMATVTIPMPEKTTKWRLTGRGCTVDTLVGEIKVNAITRKDFFLDIKVPSIVTEGDKIRVHARLHNLTDFEGTAEVKLRMGVAPVSRLVQKDTVIPKQIAISKKGTTDVIFDPIAIPARDQLSVEVTARAGGMTDGVGRDIPIRPWGMEHAYTKSGTANGNTAIDLELPSNQRYTRRRLTIEIGQNVSRLIYELALNRHHPPRVRRPVINPAIRMSGDTGSDLLALAYALGYVKTAGGYETDNRDLLEAGRTHVGRLVTTQNQDGGWSWIGSSHRRRSGSDLHVTSRNLWAMAEGRRQGILVDDRTFSKAISYLKEAFAKTEQSDDETKATILHALSTVGEADFAYANRLYRGRHRMRSSALAYTVLLFVNLGRLEIAGEILDVLNPSPTRGAESPRFKEGPETTALTLLAMEAVRPSSPWVKAAVGYLISQRRSYGYSPYKAKGPVVAALATYYQRIQHFTNDYKLTIAVNDQEIETIEMRQDAPNAAIDVPAKMLVDGRNKIALTLDGRGRYTYIATLSGFSPQVVSWSGVEPRPNGTRDKPLITKRHYYHAPLEYRGREISAPSTTEITQLPSGARTYVTVNIIKMKAYPSNSYIIVDEYFPAGTTLVEDSVSGSYQHYEVGDGVIRFYYLPKQRVRDYLYQLVSYAPGDYRVLPTVIRDAMRLGEIQVTEPSTLTVLAPGEKSADPYEMNYTERYTLGKAYFDDGRYSDALPLLAQLHEQKPDYNEQDTARMLLWMYTTEKYYNARKVIEAFEILRERYPELYIPFDKMRVVGTAYRDIEEFERASLVYRATVDASFTNDSRVSAVLQDEGQFLRSINFVENLWYEYPDTSPVISAYFALAQSLYANKDAEMWGIGGEARANEEVSSRFTKQEILQQTVRILSQFLTLYPMHPLVDDAAFSLTNAFLDLEDFPRVVHLCRLNQERYQNSELLSSFQYIEALGLFSLQQYNEAIRAATMVAAGESEDRDFARYILGQIHHAQGEPTQAIEWYNRVKTIYPDANESIIYFEEKRISLPEVMIKHPDQAVKFPLKYRNIKEAAIQVYRVDLMKLYLREKDLSRVTQVRLAGIEPEVSQSVALGDGKDYVDKTREIALPLTEEGAYLVICRGDSLFTSGLILITPLEIEVQEDVVSGRLRVNVRNVVTGSYQSKVHVKAIASADAHFISGETDLRGIFIADGMRGKATIIARDAANRYAFHRGTEWLGAQEKAKRQQQDEQMRAPRRPTDYRMHLNRRNEAIQSSNVEAFDQMRRRTKGGVQVQKAY